MNEIQLTFVITEYGMRLGKVIKKWWNKHYNGKCSHGLTFGQKVKVIGANDLEKKKHSMKKLPGIYC